MFYYIYILQSEKDSYFYTGYTFDLKNRLDDHNRGKVLSTKFRRPLHLVYFEGCLSQKDALHREKYLKTAWGKRYIKTRMKHYLTGRGEASTTEITRNTDAKGFQKNKITAKKGGKIAGDARKALEIESGKKVVSSENYLPEKKTKELKKKKKS